MLHNLTQIYSQCKGEAKGAGSGARLPKFENQIYQMSCLLGMNPCTYLLLHSLVFMSVS